MTEHPGTSSSPREQQAAFPVTRWSVVLAAKQGGDAQSGEALETLCRAYWYPLYAFVRGSGWSPADAQDLTQEFFARLISRNYLRTVEPEKGRFRTFLRVALKRFLANEWERMSAAKRGSGQPSVPFDTTIAETRFAAESSRNATPDRLYDRHWALALLDQTTVRLAGEYESCGKGDEFQRLKPYLTAERGSIPYSEIAAALRVNEGAARVSLHRMRKRFREIFRETILDTVSSPSEVEAEMREVLEILRGQ